VIVVTGAAGFIGSCVLERLNSIGREDVIIVDQSGKASKDANLKGKKYLSYFDKEEFLNMVKNDNLDEEVECIIHMGACSSTILDDKEYYEKNNFEYTKILSQWALDHQKRFIYASSAATYGSGENGYKDDDDTIRKCKPLNFYGESKQKFDQWVLDNGLGNRFVGLKFFNVFGPNEYHKEGMKSVIAKAYPGVAGEGKMVLFKSYNPEYKDGEQKRDFIYVKDAVDIVMFFFNDPGINGIFNVGTGKARTWNDLAYALFKAVGREVNIEYVEMPDNIRGQYQYFTQADVSKLRAAGYSKPFMELEDSIKDYVEYLKEDVHI